MSDAIWLVPDHAVMVQDFLKLGLCGRPCFAAGYASPRKSMGYKAKVKEVLVCPNSYGSAVVSASMALAASPPRRDAAPRIIGR